MDSDNKFYLWSMGLILAFSLALILGIRAGFVRQHEAATAAGLVEGTLPGLTGSYWVRP